MTATAPEKEQTTRKSIDMHTEWVLTYILWFYDTDWNVTIASYYFAHAHAFLFNKAAYSFDPFRPC